MPDNAPLALMTNTVLGLDADPHAAAEFMLELARLARGADRVTDLPPSPSANG